MGILLQGGNFTISEVQEVMGGHLLIADVTYGNDPRRIIHVYALVVKSEQLAILQQLPLLLATSRLIILAGDFSCFINGNARPRRADSELDATSRFLMDDQLTSKGTWKLSVKLLTTEIIEEVKRVYTVWRTVKHLFESLLDWWEAVKGNIKRTFILKDVQKKLHKESSVLSNLKEKDGSVTSSKSDILRISKSFYARLYDMNPTDSMAFQSFLMSIMEVLDNSTWETLDQPSSLDELTMAVEQEKAFDRISHTYMRDLPSKMGFVERMCNWIQLLYTSINLVLWKHRSHSIVGKSLVIRCEAFPLLLYVAQVCPNPRTCAIALTPAIFHFIWTSKKNTFDHEFIRMWSAYGILKTLQEKE
eukprot:g43602.t1